LWSIAELDRLNRIGAEYQPNPADTSRQERLHGWHAAVTAARDLPRQARSQP
jgi:hypothetical protein